MAIGSSKAPVFLISNMLGFGRQVRSKLQPPAADRAKSKPNSALRLGKASRFAAALGGGIGALAFFGGTADLRGAVWATGLLLAGLAVWTACRPSLHYRVISRLAAALVVFLGAVTLSPGRTSLVSAIPFLLLGSSLLLVTLRQGIIGQLLACATVVVCALDLKNRLFATGPSSGLPIHISLALVVLCAGTLLLRPHSGLMATVFSRSLGGHMARRLFPVGILTLVVAGWLWRTGAPHGYLTNLALPFLLLGLVTSVIWTCASALNRVDAERSLANLRMRASEKRYETIVESLPQLVWTCTANGAGDYLSPQWVAYTGIPERQQAKWGWIQQIHPADRDPMLEQWAAAIRTGEPFQFELRIRRYDGQYRWFQARATPFRNAAGQIVKWFGFSIDIHDLLETRITLEREQQRLGNLVELAPAVFCSFALNHEGIPCLTYASPGIVDLLGVYPDDVIEDANSLFGLIHQDDFQRVFAFIMASEEAVHWDSEFRVHHPKKGERWIEVHCAPAADEDGTVWHGFLSDITDRKRLEADKQFLFDLGSQLQTATNPEAILELTTSMLVDHFEVAGCSLNGIDFAGHKITRLPSQSKAGRPLPPGPASYPLSAWANDNAIALLASGRTLAVANTATDPITADRYLTAFKPSDVGATLVIPWRREGEWVYIVSLVVPEPRQWTRREIDLARSAVDHVWPCYEAARARAAERAMNQALASSEERLRLALQSAAISIWETNAVTEVIYMDAPFRTIYGFPPDLEVRRETIRSCIHPEDRAIMERNSRAFRDPAGDGRLATGFRILSWNDGSLRYLYAQGQMFFEGEGDKRRCVRSIGTLQDVTALKQREEALRRANRELEQFAYAAAHDLQEPLRNVALTTQLLAKRYRSRLDANADELLNVAAEEPIRMHEMVKGLLAFARVHESEEAEIIIADSNAVLAQALQNLQMLTQETQAEISWDRLPAVRMSELHLLQIFQNLLSNSLKYSGGKRPRVHVSSACRDGIWAFSVQDNGLGIEPQYRDHVFGVFKRLHGRGIPGTGIGLALCRRIVEHYGGRIWIESAKEEGIALIFTPPLAGERQTRHTTA